MAQITGETITTDSRYRTTSWDGLANGDTGKEVSTGAIDRPTIQVSGTFGTGGAVTIEGSMDGVTWSALHRDGSGGTSGNELVVDAAGIVRARENPRYVRPNVTAGDGATVLDVVLGGHVVQ